MKQFLFLLFLWISGIASAATVDTILVRSAKMQKDIQVITIVPDVAQAKRCPVVYLLHGHGGYYKSWLIIKPNLPELADEKGFIFVCPDGEESWYWDSPLHADVQYETFISSELVQYIDAHYPTDARRERRAISGLSMGGHGALWNAIRHTDVFGAAGSMSGGVDIRPFPKSWNMYKQLGERDVHPDVWDAHTVANLVPQLEPGRLALIIDCGTEDFFLEVNRQFHAALLEKGIPHDFIVRPGAHNVAYWNNSIDYHLLFFQKYFSK